MYDKKNFFIQLVCFNLKKCNFYIGLPFFPGGFWIMNFWPYHVKKLTQILQWWESVNLSFFGYYTFLFLLLCFHSPFIFILYWLLMYKLCVCFVSLGISTHFRVVVIRWSNLVPRIRTTHKLVPSNLIKTSSFAWLSNSISCCCYPKLHR